jgi:hypothetical protein
VIPRVIEAPASDSVHLTKPISNGTSHTLPPIETAPNPLQPPDESVKQSAVKALRGILKKPKRRSKEESKLLEVPELVIAPGSSQASAASSVAGGIVPEISSRHSDDENSGDLEELGGLKKRGGSMLVDKKGEVEEKRVSRGIQRGSLQLASFDRTLFAIRGAELRNEYMRDSYSRRVAELEL